MEKTTKKATFKSIVINGISIRTGNLKIGEVMNVSLLPVASCNKDVPCKFLCYDNKLANFRSSIKKSRLGNWIAFKRTPDLYFQAIDQAVKKHKPEFFRWHVGGDIPSQEYLENMVAIALNNPSTKFLAMTKSRHLDYSVAIGIPNLTILASQWGEYVWDQNNTLGHTDIRFKQDKKSRQLKDHEILCCGECEKCDHLCWSLKPSQTVVFDQH